ncbi:hypothetical protein [Verrucomicrobium sp. 3C]|uniref:DUF7689 domain-containing protein n=1 Tax=Verrucomicrobium sp. 3C TaxID=1134055 RepID=UPI000377ECBE|nr:hypothetical protein [Verrucomicrobium sp. 3C]
MSDRLADWFPQLTAGSYAVTSRAQFDYNCVAWALGETIRWWWPDESEVSYWPEGVRRHETLEAFVEAFRLFGFEECQNPDLEPGWQKIAIYGHEDGCPTHAARQLADGTWTSKLGRLEDISHANLDQLTGSAYGRPVLFLRRRRGRRASSPEEANP